MKGDIADQDLVSAVWREHGVTRWSTSPPRATSTAASWAPAFVEANVVGTQVLLDVAKANAQKFLQVSTDEVYGSLPEDRPEIKFTEETRWPPTAPTAPARRPPTASSGPTTTRSRCPCSPPGAATTTGPTSSPEKLIPLFVTNLMEGRKVPLYGDGMNVRDWLYVDDHCDAVWIIAQQGSPARSTTSAATTSCPTGRSPTQSCGRWERTGTSPSSTSRTARPRPPVRDRREQDPARRLGWQPKHRFDEAIKTTIRWYRQNEPWWRAIRNKEYLKYYEQQYANR